MTHFPNPNPQRRAPRIQLSGSIPALVMLEDGERAKGKLQSISITGGLLRLAKSLEQGDFVEIAFQTQSGPVHGMAEMLGPTRKAQEGISAGVSLRRARRRRPPHSAHGGRFRDGQELSGAAVQNSGFLPSRFDLCPAFGMRARPSARLCPCFVRDGSQRPVIAAFRQPSPASLDPIPANLEIDVSCSVSSGTLPWNTQFLGAGAVGGLVGAALASLGESVTVIVRPESEPGIRPNCQ